LKFDPTGSRTHDYSEALPRAASPLDGILRSPKTHPATADFEGTIDARLLALDAGTANSVPVSVEAGQDRPSQE